MSLCPEARARAAMSDGEFWEHALLPHESPDTDDDWDQADMLLLDEPCPVCGGRGACAWDADGRALIHTTPEEDEHDVTT